MKDDRSRTELMERKERRIGRTLAKFALLAILLAAAVAAIVTRNWLLFGLALLVFVPLLILLMAPLWLPATTQIAQRTEGRADAEEEGPIPPP